MGHSLFKPGILGHSFFAPARSFETVKADLFRGASSISIASDTKEQGSVNGERRGRILVGKVARHCFFVIRRGMVTGVQSCGARVRLSILPLPPQRHFNGYAACVTSAFITWSLLIESVFWWQLAFTRVPRPYRRLPPVTRVHGAVGGRARRVI